MEVIPAIDLLGGRCVRLYQGDFGRVTSYDRDPLEIATLYQQAGAGRLHLVDLDGARSGTPGNAGIVRSLAARPGLRLQVGGGIRSLETARMLIEAGADRVVLGSLAINDPPTVLGWLATLGSERVVLAFDVRLQGAQGEPVAVTHGWQESSGRRLWELFDTYLAAGARHFLCTDVGRDGTLAGPNTALYAECLRRYPGARLIASGGLSSAADLPALAETGVAGVVTGKALLEGHLTLEEIGPFLRTA